MCVTYCHRKFSCSLLCLCPVISFIPITNFTAIVYLSINNRTLARGREGEFIPPKTALCVLAV